MSTGVRKPNEATARLSHSARPVPSCPIEGVCVGP